MWKKESPTVHTPQKLLEGPGRRIPLPTWRFYLVVKVKSRNWIQLSPPCCPCDTLEARIPLTLSFCKAKSSVGMVSCSLVSSEKRGQIKTCLQPCLQPNIPPLLWTEPRRRYMHKQSFYSYDTAVDSSAEPYVGTNSDRSAVSPRYGSCDVVGGGGGVKATIAILSSLAVPPLSSGLCSPQPPQFPTDLMVHQYVHSPSLSQTRREPAEAWLASLQV